MRLSGVFAWRYLFSPKSSSVVNIISVVAAVAVGLPVAAMVVLLSVFNGFEGLVKDMYGEFDPEILITPARGRVFDSVPQIDGVVSEVLEGEVLLSYRGRQREATLRGVDSMYELVVPIEGMVVAGEWQLMHGELEEMVLGAGVAYDLNVNVNLLDQVEVFAPRKGSTGILPMDAFRARRLWPVGVFALDAETDGKYVLAPIESVRAVLGYPEGVSALMVRGGDAEELRAKLGDGVKVQTRLEQKATLYTIMRYEKWGIFLIVLMVMIIASMAIVGSLVMLVIEKREDIKTLRALGAQRRFLRSVFIREGMLIASLGAAGGMILGLAVCWAQQVFGFVGIPARTFMVEAYPVAVHATDLVLIVAAFFAVSFIIVMFTVGNAIHTK